MSTATGGAATVSTDGDRIGIDGTIDFDNASSLLDQVRTVLLATPAVTIDLGGVRRSNSAGLALMIEWLAIARECGHGVRFERVPDGLRQIARVCQVEALIVH